MKIVVRCIYYKAVTPSCDIIEMEHDNWLEFLHADPNKRKDIALKLIGKEFLSTHVKEMVWIPLDGQNKVIENPTLGMNEG